MVNLVTLAITMLDRIVLRGLWILRAKGIYDTLVEKLGAA